MRNNFAVGAVDGRSRATMAAPDCPDATPSDLTPVRAECNGRSRAAAIDTALAAHAELVTALRDPFAYPHPVEAVEVCETHISSVLLAGEYAYKLKKPVELGFADFSTLARRRHFCHEELRLNRRSAPSLYLDVVSVTRSHPDAAPRINGAGAVIDYAVRMYRFAPDARLDQMTQAGTLDTSLIDRLSKAIAAFHARAASVSPDSTFGMPEEIQRWTKENLAELLRLTPDAAQRRRLRRLTWWCEAEFARRLATFAERRTTGSVRECHGDLHLGNVVLIAGEPLLFDCIEFNPQLRFIDVISDVAFMWMDLIEHRLPALAWRLLNGYLEQTGDFAGLALLRFYAVYRALVRAKVALIRCGQPDVSAAEREWGAQACARYLALAEQLVQPRSRPLVLTCGVTGSGKTTVSQHLLEALGAVRVRSDIERKRLAGLSATAHAPATVGEGLYDDTATRRTYEQLKRAASMIIDAGFPAIVDATFVHQADRRPFQALAEQLGSQMTIVICEAAPETLRSRVAARARRGDDASDATLDVLAHQLAAFETPVADVKAVVQRIDTDTDRQTLAARCEAFCRVWNDSAQTMDVGTRRAAD